MQNRRPVSLRGNTGGSSRASGYSLLVAEEVCAGSASDVRADVLIRRLRIVETLAPLVR
jgi:hypothetical protein